MKPLTPLLAPLLLGLAACATAPQAPDAPPANPAGGRCNAAAVQGHIGHLARTEAGPVLLRESGARVLRWIAEGSPVTMDYSEERLNAVYGTDLKITELTCG